MPFVPILQPRPRHDGSRLISISKNMSRLQLHEASVKKEGRLNLILPDGESGGISDAIRHAAFRKLGTAHEDAIACAGGNECQDKLRFEVCDSHEGNRVRPITYALSR